MSDYKPFDANGTMHVRLPKRYRQPRVIGSWHFRLGKWQIRIATNWPLFLLALVDASEASLRNSCRVLSDVVVSGDH